jgi:hypothetical protein
VTTAIIVSAACAAAYFVYQRWDYLVDVGTRGVLRFLSAVVIIEAVVVALAAGVCWAAHRALGLTAPWALTAVTLPVVLGACHLFWTTEIRVERIEKMGRPITQPRTREAVHARIRRLVAAMQEEATLPTLDLLAAAQVLHKGRYYQEALDVLERIPSVKLSAYEAEFAAVLRLTCRVYMNDKLGSAEAFDALPSLSKGSDHASLRDLCRALTLVRAGRIAEASELASAVPEDHCVAARNMVLAHIHTAQQRPDDAKRNLDVLTKDRGEEGLRWVVDTEGPASPVAQHLLDGRSGPYR